MRFNAQRCRGAEVQYAEMQRCRAGAKGAEVQRCRVAVAAEGAGAGAGAE